MSKNENSQRKPYDFNRRTWAEAKMRAKEQTETIPEWTGERWDWDHMIAAGALDDVMKEYGSDPKFLRALIDEARRELKVQEHQKN
ncbi:hypothetical protein ABZU94_38545 [Streptomyces mirabilis]|uniref:hypothetical protein n=1 Tax=Streptomyces sp. NPDC005388 TaxID=3156717 RepID=UPI0033AC0DA1